MARREMMSAPCCRSVIASLRSVEHRFIEVLEEGKRLQLVCCSVKNIALVAVWAFTGFGLQVRFVPERPFGASIGCEELDKLHAVECPFVVVIFVVQSNNAVTYGLHGEVFGSCFFA